jgi:phytoene synthase
MTPEKYCEHKAAPPGSDLYYALLRVPLEMRRALLAVHALKRELHEAVAEAFDPGVASARLLWWREELTEALDGTARHPVAQVIGPVCVQMTLPRELLFEMIEGAQMDLDYNRYPDFATLEVYCHRNMGAACAISARVLEHGDAQHAQFGRTLGIALQLTALIRDAGLDARRNRVYFPLEALQRCALDTTDIIAMREDERFEALMGQMIEQARSWFTRADAQLPSSAHKTQRPLLAHAAIKRALLHEIAALRGHTLRQRVALTPLRKLWVAWRVK